MGDKDSITAWFPGTSSPNVEMLLRESPVGHDGGVCVEAGVSNVDVFFVDFQFLGLLLTHT